MSTAEVVQYVQWRKDVAHHDYAAASSYLSIRFGESRAREVSKKLQKLPVITRRANDILRATRRDPLSLSDPGVLKDLKKVLAGQKLSPVLVAEGDIADGYHRVSLAYCLDLGAETLEMMREADQRPRFMPLADATYAAVPETTPSASPVGRQAYVCLALTERLLLTRHSTPCPVLAEIRDQYSSLPEDTKTDGPAVLFMVLDRLLREKEPQLLSLGARLNEIQLMLRTSSPPETHDEIMGILRTLTELVQGLTWYGSDLDDVAGTIGQLPGMRGGVTERFSHHCERVSRMRESARDYRQQAKDAFDHYSSNAANRQGQLINVLTVVATLFLPLTFLTGFFGMDFGVLVKDLNSTWAFVVLGLLLPAATVAITLLLYRRLLQRFGVGKLTHP